LLESAISCNSWNADLDNLVWIVGKSLGSGEKNTLNTITISLSHKSTRENKKNYLTKN
jgi:hypothetical protein